MVDRLMEYHSHVSGTLSSLVVKQQTYRLSEKVKLSDLKFPANFSPLSSRRFGNNRPVRRPIKVERPLSSQLPCFNVDPPSMDTDSDSKESLPEYQKMRSSQIKISSQYRMYRERKKYMKVKNAVIQIQSCVRGYEARKLYGKRLRKYAGPKIVRFIRQSLAVRFILMIKNNLPSQSPLDNEWPSASKMFSKASESLKKMYHAWRCAVYRKHLPTARKKILSEKLQASELFKDKKKGYKESVAKEFKGDHIALDSVQAWAKAKAKFQNNLTIVFADYVTKVHRSNAKEVRKVLIVTQSEFMLLNPKTMQLLHRVQLSDIEKISTSPYQDDLVVFHLREDKVSKSLNKGDFVFHCTNVIELISKSVIQIREEEKRLLTVSISDSFVARMKGKNVDIVMHSSSADGSRVVLRRKGSTMEQTNT